MKKNEVTVNVCINKNRIKEYGNDIYLKDRQEFELEFFNGSTQKKSIEISMNGKLISSSKLVINPGQRIYLDRFLDENRKFMFSTYEVDNQEDVKKAIVDNGRLNIKFYNEYVPFRTTYYTNIPYYQPYYYSNYPTTTFTCSNTRNIISSKESIETGRIEMGNISNQTFSSDYSNFCNFASEIIELQILPISIKPLNIKNIKQYCTECGTRKKHSWKFCPTCSTKF